MNRHLITALAALLALPLIPSAMAADSIRIKKCQDASGKWHYGDTAGEECARSRVIDLDKRGIQRKETPPPLTEAELKAREENRAADEQRQKIEAENKRRDQQLLATYAFEADIVQSRDRTLLDLDKQIHATEETLESLQKGRVRLDAQAEGDKKGGKNISPQTQQALDRNAAQTKAHESSLETLKKKRDTTSAQYDSDLKRFRELKSRQPVAEPATPAKR